MKHAVVEVVGVAAVEDAIAGEIVERRAVDLRRRISHCSEATPVAAPPSTVIENGVVTAWCVASATVMVMDFVVADVVGAGRAGDAAPWSDRGWPRAADSRR